MRLILLPALLIYAASIYWVLKHYQFKTVWTGGLEDFPNQSGQLTKFVKRVLDGFLVFILSIMILWLPVMVVMAISQTQVPTWGIDIAAFAGFKIDLNEFPGITLEGLRHPEISDKTMLNIDTSNPYAWYMFAISQQITAAISFYVLIQIRAVVISLMKGLSFDSENGNRIKRIGIVVVVWNIVIPLFQYFGWGSVIEQISISSNAIQLYPSFALSPLGILIGLLLYLLSGMMREASAMRAEQELTI